MSSHMVRYCKIFFLFLVIFSSCNNEKNERIKKLNTSLIKYNKENKLRKIEIDSTLKRLKFSEKKDYEFKLVVYFLGDCDLCYPKINRWKSLIQNFDSINPNISYDFIIGGENTDFIKQSLKKIDFPEELVILDELDIFIRTYPFLNDPAFNTMILNGDDQVLYIGSPLDSKNLEKHYINILKNQGSNL